MRARGQFHVEAYNIFNHTNFGNATTNTTTPVDMSAQFDKNGTQVNEQFGPVQGSAVPTAPATGIQAGLLPAAIVAAFERVHRGAIGMQFPINSPN
jgi:hypothetical protein